MKRLRKPIKYPRLYLILALVGIAFAACDRNETEIVLRGETMGTTYQVRIHAPQPELDEDELQSKLTNLLKELNGIFSNWDPDSELSRLNRANAGPLSLSDEMTRLLSASLRMSRLSGGAFDPTVPPLLRVWGFGPGIAKGTPGRVPKQNAIDRARRRVGYQKIRLRDGTLRKPTGTELDFSAIAKGHVVDRAFTLLKESGVRNGMMVEIGGEIRVSPRSDGRPWRIGLERPRYDGARDLLRVAYVREGAVASSGDYRNYFVIEEQRFAHVIDPRTGAPARSRLAAATVIGPDCSTADALATTLLVLGREAGMDLCESREFSNFECLLIEHDAGEESTQNPHKQFQSSGMNDFLRAD